MPADIRSFFGSSKKKEEVPDPPAEPSGQKKMRDILALFYVSIHGFVNWSYLQYLFIPKTVLYKNVL